MMENGSEWQQRYRGGREEWEQYSIPVLSMEQYNVTWK